ncbi:MAG: dihydroneopterin aldolase [Pedosphaera sp.]|nr:dihydroneopterin aldolase [Pedosphaera sp.]
MSDTIVIRDLEVWCHAGVSEAERDNAQRLSISLKIWRDVTKAAATDDLENTIDYFAVSQRLLTFGDGRSWKLIEKLAVDIALMVRKEFGAEKVGVEVRKFIIPQARYVSVRVTRP